MPREVFIVGCGRSGTTLLYELLACHRETTWISTWSERTGLPQFAKFNGLFRLARRGEVSRRGIPRPAEGYREWTRILGELPAGETGARAAASVDRRKLEDWLDAYRRYGGAPVFLNKNTGHSRRIEMLHSLLPQACIISVVRHPLDVVSSLLKVKWWPQLHLWTEDGSQPGDRPLDEQAEMAARLWRAEVHAIEGAAPVGGGVPIHFVHYEQLTSSLSTSIATCLDFIQVDPDSQVDAVAARVRVRRRAGPAGSALPAHLRRRIWALTESTASRYGYTHER